jgi:hypothetical protein
MIDRRYLEEKLRAASDAITDSDRPVRERLRLAHYDRRSRNSDGGKRG